MKPEEVAKIFHHFGGGVYAKETVIPVGFTLTQHIHKYDHLSILAKGKAVVEVDGESRVIDGPACLLIRAGKEHAVTSITDVTWYCVHATEETDAAKVDQVLIHG